jgi:hydroxypyruvate isomerase
MYFMDRRSFIATSIAASVTLGAGINPFKTQAAKTSSHKPFKLKYAPSLNSFWNLGGKDMGDRIRFMHDQGFRAIFDNGLMKKSRGHQEKIASTLRKYNMDLGPFVGYADFKVKSFVLPFSEVKVQLDGLTNQWIETHKVTGVKTVLAVPGRYDESLEWDYQTANVIDNLKYCADICQKVGLIIVIEPLNRHNHPGLFLTGIPQSYQICKAVDNPCCKIVNDLYHQQITEGNLIPNIDRAWSQIGAFHIGDNPGRKEPGTGEINYKNIFKHIHGKGFDGVLCMEHGNSIKGKEGEQALINAYRACDNF